jgi:hypothetical protein
MGHREGIPLRRQFWGTDMPGYLWALSAIVVVALAAAWMWFSLRRVMPQSRVVEARRAFHRQRERLEGKFVQIGSSPAKPDTPRWADCEFEDDITFAKNRTTGELTALVGVTIEIEDIADWAARSGEAVGHLRAATAVFRFQRDHWETDGRAIFNLTPAEALRRYHRDLEVVILETANRR